MPPPPCITHSAMLLHKTKTLQLNTPQYTGRLCYLLTLKHNMFWLTNVNKIIYRSLIINELRNINCNPKLPQIMAELTKYTHLVLVCNEYPMGSRLQRPRTSPTFARMSYNINLAIQILPLGIPKDEAYRIIDAAIALVQQSGLKYQVCPFETVIEGPYNTVMQLVNEMQDACYSAGAKELLVNMKLHRSVEKDMAIEHKTGKYQ